jgi:hypothetical protein
MTIRFRSFAFLIYVIIGIVVAWNRGYIAFGWLKATASVLLAVFLWWLALLASTSTSIRASSGRGTQPLRPDDPAPLLRG